MPPPPGFGLKIDVGSIATELAKNPDITQGGTVHLGELIVSASGLISQSGTTLKFLSPDDISVSDAGFLGRGSSGSVRKVRRAGTDTYMALKEIRVTSQAHLQEIRRELATLHVDTGDAVPPTRCPYLVDFYGAFSHEGCVYIAMECMDGALTDLTQIPDPVLASMTKDVVRGLEYLHMQRRLIHRDLKPGNILYNAECGSAKISDFGVSSALDQSSENAHTFVGTVTYMSPERLKGESYSFAGDIWSLGISIAELALGGHPYATLTAHGESTEAKFWVLMQHLNNSDSPAIELPPTMNPLLADFIQQCLAKDPATRPSARELLEHPWIRGLTSTDDDVNHDKVRRWLQDRKKALAAAAAAGGGGTTPVPVTPVALGGSGINLDSALTRLVDMKKR